MSSQATSTLSVSQLVLKARELEIESARCLAARAEFIDFIGQAIHALQRERGSAAVLLASEGRRFAEVHRITVEESQEAEARLRTVFETYSTLANAGSARSFSLMAWVLLGLDALHELRSRIARAAISAHDSVVAYSRLIAGLVELIFHVADVSLLPGVASLLVALVYLVQGKEAAGQERAVGALQFASGSSSEAHRLRLVHLIDVEERSLQVFAEFAEPGLKQRWSEAELSPGTARLERLRRNLCSAPAGASLDSELADVWFGTASERITALWRLQVDMVTRLREECGAQIAAAQQDLQDSEGLLRKLQSTPPTQAHAVDRFFDVAASPDVVSGWNLQWPAAQADAGASPLTDLLQAQTARLSRVEAELAAARRALHERKLIERAKGLLMERLGMTEEEAFRALQKTSMDQNRRLVEVAEAALSLPELAFAQLGEAAR